MQKKVIVISLGGSLIIPDNVDTNFLRKFKNTILKNAKKYKFVIVCGGGSIARKYISSLKEIGINEKFQSFAGISATRMNARFMSYFFNFNPERGIPHTMKHLKKYVKKQDVVFCGALEYKPNQTSDATATEIARHFKSAFINLTNVLGVYTKNPAKHKDAKLIKKMTWLELYKKTNASKYKPGQHLILDQTATKRILKNKITTYVLGKNMKNLDNLLNERKFKGTIICS